MSSEALPLRSIPAPRVSQRLEYVDALKCYATVLVVIIHVSSSASYGWHQGAQSAWWWGTAMNAFSRTCVPLFLMTSGAMLLDRHKLYPIGRFFDRRIKRLAAPLIFWSLVYLADRRWLMGEQLTALGALRYLFSGNTFYHMPFFYYLMGLYLSAPVFGMFADSAGKTASIYFLSLWAAFMLVQLGSELTGLATSLTVPAIAGFAGYFIAGRLLRDVAITGKAVPVCIVLVAIGWLATLLGTYEASSHSGFLNEMMLEYGRPNVACMTIPTYLIFASALFRRNLASSPRLINMLETGAALSFGVFLVHPLLLQIVIPRLHLTWNTGGPVFGILITTFCTLALSCGFVVILRKLPWLRATVS